MSKDIIKYMAGDCEIELTDDTIRTYLVNGSGKITDQELMMFKKLCEYQKLNPFLREVYIIKYSDKFPATVVTGKETFLKRANRNPLYKGHETGISDDGKTAWAKVHKDGYEVPIECVVDFNEYVGLKEGKPNKMWAAKPNTMLKKVALVQALREAFPEDLGGLYSQEEINTISQELPTVEVKLPQTKRIENQQQKADDLANDKQQNDTGEGITDPQLKLVNICLNNLNFKDPFERHSEVSNILGLAETIDSVSNLTKQQASTVIKVLKELEKEGK